MRIHDIMSTTVVRIGPDATAGDARQQLQLNEIDHLVVVDDKRVVGLLSRDSLATQPDDASVRDIMAKHVVTIEPDVTLRRGAGMMHGHHLDALPVVDGERLVGIVTKSDILHAIAKGEVHAAPPPDRVVLRKRGPRKRPVSPV